MRVDDDALKMLERVVRAQRMVALDAALSPDDEPSEQALDEWSAALSSAEAFLRRAKGDQTDE